MTKKKGIMGIQDYFLNELDNDGNNKFFGVYLVLATMIESEEDVKDLESRILENAKERNNYKLYHSFSKCLEMRKVIGKSRNQTHT